MMLWPWPAPLEKRYGRPLQIHNSQIDLAFTKGDRSTKYIFIRLLVTIIGFLGMEVKYLIVTLNGN